MKAHRFGLDSFRRERRAASVLMADREERGLLGLHADNARRGDILETRGCRHGKFAWWNDLWLGGRDSNPDNLLQRQMSYRWTTSQCESRRGSGENFRL